MRNRLLLTPHFGGVFLALAFMMRDKFLLHKECIW